jgi:hypothetical protein
MSIAHLIQVYDETRRLAIAGSMVAPGDFRLKKLIPPLEQAGAKAPVFARVAQAITAVVDSDDKTAATALLELTTLVNAILYTQGETGAPGELKPLETTDLGGQATQTGARVLKPLLEALSSTGSGRMELVKDAFDRGVFRDLRLVKPALRAIDDPYPEIGEFIAEKVLPMYGKAILPELRATLDIKARSNGQINRLQLIHQLDPQGSRDLIQSALNDGSKEMRVAAVECLGTADDDIAYLLDQARSKAKDVRAAALRALALAGSTAAEVIATLKKAITGEDLELFVAHIRQCPLPELQAYVLDQAQKQSDALLSAKDKKEQGPAVARMQQLIGCLEERTDAPAEAFLLKCFENAPAFAGIKSEPSGSDINELIAHVLSHGTAKMQQTLVAAQKKLDGGSLSPAILAARSIMTPADFYKEFSPLLNAIPEKRSKKTSGDQDRASALMSALLGNSERFYAYRYRTRIHRFRSQPAKLPLRELDPRWLDAAVNAKALDLVCELARPDHAATIQYLSEQLNSKKEPHELHQVMRTMVRIGHPTAVDAVINAIKKQAKETTHYYVGYWIGRLIPDLPRSTYPRFEELLPTLPDKMVDQLMDSVLALKNKPE